MPKSSCIQSLFAASIRCKTLIILSDYPPNVSWGAERKPITVKKDKMESLKWFWKVYKGLEFQGHSVAPHSSDLRNYYVEDGVLCMMINILFKEDSLFFDVWFKCYKIFAFE